MFAVGFIADLSVAVSLSTHIALIVADVIALQVTWRRTIENVRAASLLGNTFNLSQALFRFGQYIVYKYFYESHIETPAV